MDEDFKIYVDRLRDGKTEQIDRLYPPHFLDIEESDLKFKTGVKIKGEAYLTGESLVLHLDLSTEGIIPCSICNQPVEVEIVVKGLYHVVPIEEIKSHIYNMKELLRESILLETPPFAECNEGNCSQRKEVGKYLKKEEGTEDEGYQPFKDLTRED